MTTRYRLTVAYLGTRYCGWQRQRSAPTIQAELEAAAAKVAKMPETTVTGAGRTDAGVHATAQVAHVDLPYVIPTDGLARGLNGVLPNDIRVVEVAQRERSFHARFNARGKHYTYRVRWSRSPIRPPWIEQRVARVRRLADLTELEECVAQCIGRHDWASFTVPNPETATTVRTVFDARIRLDRWGFRLDLIGEGFLRYQVRRLTGALLQMGWGRRDRRWFSELLRCPGSGSQVFTAPARGLTLEHVYYRPPLAARPAGSTSADSGSTGA